MAAASLPRTSSIPRLRTVALVAVLLSLAWVTRVSLYESNPVIRIDQCPPRLEDSSSGYWSPAPELRNTSRVWRNQQCYARPPPPGTEQVIDDATRAEGVDGWQWVLGGGFPVRDFDIEEFAARALKSRIGFVIVGDSISQQMLFALHMMLLMPDPYNVPPTVNLMSVDPLHRMNITLDNGNPLKVRLKARQDLSHIPGSRFDEPIVRFWRTDLLVASGGYLNDTLHSIAPQGVWHDTKERRFSAWVEEIGWYNDRRLAWEGELESPVVISIGPHWDIGRFQRVEEEELFALYDTSLRKISDNLLTIPNVPLRIFYRSSLAGHEHCPDHDHPVPSYHQLAQNSTGSRYMTWHWHHFPRFNEIARAIFGNQRRGLVSTEYWDVWEMSATRPDAHIGSQPGAQRDCLHWCIGSVPQWLNRLWWHTIQTEA